MVLNTSRLCKSLWFSICQGSEYTKTVNMPQVLNKPGSGITRNLNMPCVLNIQGFLVCLSFWICKVPKYTRVLNMLGLDRVLDMPEYTCTVPGYVWLLLNMSEYAWICLGMLEYAYLMIFVLHVYFVISCQLKGVVTYFNVYTKLIVRHFPD